MVNRYYETDGWVIVGNEDYAFAHDPEETNNIHHFTRDPDVNDDAFVRACGWAYMNPQEHNRVWRSSPKLEP